MGRWYKINNPETVPSPALLVFPRRVKANIAEMIRVAGDPKRLRPHVKTHKCREIVSMQLEAGIDKFKCATIAEAEMLAEAQATDVLLAYQPTGPTAHRYLKLINKYPSVTFSALVDNLESAKFLDQLSRGSGTILGIFIDLDAGMHRTGILPGPEVSELVDYIKNAGNLKFKGWHVYDGHIRNSDFEERKKAVEASFSSVADLVSGNSSIEVVAGGSPTFPVHALNAHVNLSPGTSLLWDQGSCETMPDQQFVPAAILMTRVISKPNDNLLCLDLGHKSVASEMPHPRVYFPELPSVEFLNHSEEHLVITTPVAKNIQVGEVIYGIPMHICPTTALHQELIVIDNGEEVDRWQVYARDRRITV